MELLSNQHGWDRGTPIDRYYIERFLHDYSIVIDGRVGEIGEDKYTKKFGDKDCESIILSAYKGTENTIVIDLADFETIPAELWGTFDCLILTQVLNTIYDIQSATKNIFRLLKNDGYALVTVPFLNPISLWDDSQWGEYWRFTEKSFLRLFEDNCLNGQVECFGNHEIASKFITGHVLEDKGINKRLLEKIDKQFAIVLGGIFQK
jgi:SAM-dependent methyltransferase